MKRHLFAALLAAAVLGAVMPASAYPGDRDPEFGVAGSVALNPAGQDGIEASSALLQPDGKLVITFNGVRDAFAIRRYLADGSPDLTFGDEGTASVRASNGAMSGPAALAAGSAVQPDGKIVVVGRAVTSDCSPHSYTNCAYAKRQVQSFTLARFSADGSLDLGFGIADHGFTGNSTGSVRTLFDGRGGAAKAAAIQPDGKIVAAGTAGEDALTEIAVARYQPDGSLDPSFGNGGTVTTPVGRSSAASSVMVQPDGKVVVAGSTGDPYSVTGAFAVVRYQADGSLDTTFGTNGIATTAIGELAGVTSGALQADGRIVVAGFARPAGTQDYTFALARYRPDGSLDSGFGKNGTVTTAVGDSSQANALVAQPDGTFVAAGSTLTRGARPARQMALVLYTSKGSLGPGFGSGGKVRALAANRAHDVAYGLALQPDGKLIAAGTSVIRFAGSQGGAAVHTRITMTAPKKVTFGDTIKYTVKVKNTGDNNAHNVKVTWIVPPAVDDDTLGMPAPCAFMQQHRPAMGMAAVVCDLGTLKPDASAKVVIRAKPLYAYKSTPLKNTATVSTTDRQMSPKTETEAKAAVLVTCPRNASCPGQ